LNDQKLITALPHPLEAGPRISAPRVNGDSHLVRLIFSDRG
jgi:hypothetical protein